MQTSTILCIKNWMIRILFTRFLLGNFSSCALAATVSHRVGVGTDRIKVCIPAPRNTKKSYVCFRPTCGARPNIYARFPICLNAWDAIGTCGELTVCCANTTVTYKIILHLLTCPPEGHVNKCRPSLSHGLPHSTTSELICGQISAQKVSDPNRS